MKRIMKDYFTFSRKERVAISILLSVIAFFIAAPYFYPVRFKPPVSNKALTDFLEQNKNAAPVSDSLPNRQSSFQKYNTTIPAVKHESFSFDPNTVSEEGWKRLGISDKTIHTISNYRSKGGRFRSPEDIRKIWGLKKEDADRLVSLAHVDAPANNAPVQKQTPVTPKSGMQKKIVPVDINTATIEDWKNLPGIGEALANRILKYRERINGFTNIEQVRKTYGISDSVFIVITPYLIVNAATLPKLNLNTASAFQLKRIANIPDAIARAIILYRQQYGSYQSVNDLKKIVFITDSLFQRIAPGLKVE